MRTGWRPIRGLIIVRNETAVVESRKMEGERLLGQDWGIHKHSWVSRGMRLEADRNRGPQQE